MAIYKGTTKIAGIGNTRRNIGELVPSVLPLSDAGLHLLDGALISGSGIYSEFVTYIAGLVSSYPNLFVTEANWQNSVNAYGVCGKFVYDSSANTVRLPRVTGIIEGTTVASAIGDLVEAGLPNITGRLGYESSDLPLSGAIKAGSGGYSTGRVFANYTAAQLAELDASSGNDTYGKSNTVQPQTIKAYYYIVIANSTKTSIQVDIDEIASDLNLKAETNLENVNSLGKSTAAGWGIPSGTYTDVTIGASGATYIAPHDGWLFLQYNVNSTAIAFVSVLQYGHVDQQVYIGAAYNNVYIFTPIKAGSYLIDYANLTFSQAKLFHLSGQE